MGGSMHMGGKRDTRTSRHTEGNRQTGISKGDGGRITTRARAQVPVTAGYQRAERAIRHWVETCARENCFCPSDADARVCLRSNVCEYLCSPGTDQGKPNDASTMALLLRVSMERNPTPVVSRVADQFRRGYGDQLCKFWHIYKERSVYMLLFEELKNIVVKLGGLLGVPIYATQKHIARLGLLDLLPAFRHPGNHNLPGPFVREFQFKSGEGQPAAEGVGVNMWALLLMVSLAGSDEIHNKNSSRVSRALLELILRRAPRAATPGHRVWVRSVNTTADSVESVQVAYKEQPESFLRPLDDVKFAKHGVYTYCPATEDGQMPEDWLHCAQITRAAGLLACKWYEVPPLFLKSQYQVMTDRYYSVWRSGDMNFSAATGTLYVNRTGGILRYEAEEMGYIVRLNVLSWQEELAQIGFILMPMVFRSGALVDLGHSPKRAGCLVPLGTERSLEALGIDVTGMYVSNFDHVKCGYHAQHREGELTFMDPMTTLNNLVPVGQVLWLKGESQTFGEFIDEKLIPEAEDDQPDDVRCLECRLSVPTIVVSLASFTCVHTRLLTPWRAAEPTARRRVRDRAGAQEGAGRRRLHVADLCRARAGSHPVDGGRGRQDDRQAPHGVARLRALI